MKKRILILVGAAAVIAVLLWINKSRQASAYEVETSKAALRTIVQTVAANGKIQPETDIKISADVSGEITELHVEEGDTVEQGQLLAKIWPELYLTAVDRATAGLNSAKVNLSTSEIAVKQAQSRYVQAENDYERNKKLFQDKVISKAEFDAITASYEVALEELKAARERVQAARFGVQNAQAGLNEARENLSRTSIFSPATGVVSRLNIEQGEKVVGTAQMAGTEMMVISNFNQMEVIVEVNENDILSISKGDTARIEVDAYGSRQFDGIVTEIAKSAMTGTGMSGTSEIANFEVKVLILQSSYADLLKVSSTPFLPGLSASVEIETEKRNEVLSLPIECVTTRENEEKGASGLREEVVFIEQDGKAELIKVETGIQDSRYIEVVNGVDSSMSVISGPYNILSRNLKDGSPVEVLKK